MFSYIYYPGGPAAAAGRGSPWGAITIITCFCTAGTFSAGPRPKAKRIVASESSRLSVSASAPIYGPIGWFYNYENKVRGRK